MCNCIIFEQGAKKTVSQTHHSWVRHVKREKEKKRQREKKTIARAVRSITKCSVIFFNYINFQGRAQKNDRFGSGKTGYRLLYIYVCVCKRRGFDRVSINREHIHTYTLKHAWHNTHTLTINNDFPIPIYGTHSNVCGTLKHCVLNFFFISFKRAYLLKFEHLVLVK